MFIDSRITFELSEERLEGFWIEWGFDEIFTTMISHDYDGDGNGSFSAAEQEAIREGAFSNLENHHYFTYILYKDGTYQPKEVESFSAWLEDGRLYYRFFVPHTLPVEGEEKTLRVAIYDKSFYCDIAPFEKEPVKIRTRGAVRTDSTVEKNRDLEIRYSPVGGRKREGKDYSGLAYPDQIALSFQRSGG